MTPFVCSAGGSVNSKFSIKLSIRILTFSLGESSKEVNRTRHVYGSEKLVIWYIIKMALSAPPDH